MNLTFLLNQILNHSLLFISWKFQFYLMGLSNLIFNTSESSISSLKAFTSRGYCLHLAPTISLLNKCNNSDQEFCEIVEALDKLSSIRLFPHNYLGPLLLIQLRFMVWFKNRFAISAWKYGITIDSAIQFINSHTTTFFTVWSHGNKNEGPQRRQEDTWRSGEHEICDVITKENQQGSFTLLLLFYFSSNSGSSFIISFYDISLDRARNFEAKWKKYCQSKHIELFHFNDWYI